MTTSEYLNNSSAILDVSKIRYHDGGRILLDVIQQKKETALRNAMIQAGKGQDLKALRLLNTANTCDDILDFVNEAIKKTEEEDL